MKGICMTLLWVMCGLMLPITAQGEEIPLKFHRKFSGEQKLPLPAAGRALNPEGTRLDYRIITSKAQLKKAWGYLYDKNLEVDFTQHHVLAIYKFPAKGSFEFRPTRVYNLDKTLMVDIDVTWTGKTARTYPFLFLVVDRFSKLQVKEKFIAPSGKPQRFP